MEKCKKLGKREKRRLKREKLKLGDNFSQRELKKREKLDLREIIKSMQRELAPTTPPSNNQKSHYKNAKVHQ